MAKREKAKAKEQQQEALEQEKDRQVAAIIQTVLEENGRAIQPYMVYSQNGIAPQVRLVRVNKQDNAIETGNQEQAGGNQEADGATGAE